MIEIREAVSRLLDEAGIGEPPVDLYEVAALRGITKVEVAELKSNEYGILTTGRRGHTVTINSKHKVRARFTLAHEIAHTLVDEFAHSKVDAPLANLKPKGARPLESLCDEIAAEILFPYQMFLDAIEAEDAGIDGVLRLARLFDGSVMATANRVGHLTREPVQVISWFADGNNLKAGQRSGSGFLTSDGALPYRALTQTDSVPVRAFHSGKRERGCETPVALKPWNVYEIEAQRMSGGRAGYVLSVIKPEKLAS
jgi:Zn-dependent peptidase ImmA (M78 family)